MRDRLDDLGPDVAVAMVTFTSDEELATYRSERSLPFPVLLDRERSAYAAYGLARGSVSRVWGWRAARRYAQIVRSSGLSGLRRPTEDTLQLGGDFVVAPDGTLAWGHWGAGPDDRPAVDELIGAIHATR